MTPERYKQVRDIFHSVCELPATQRRDYLNRECGDDASLVAEVEALLAKDSDSGFLTDDRVGFARRLLDEPHPFDNEPLEATETVVLPESIGPYRIVRLLGEGGMGVVYEATQTRPHRRVALKVLRPGVASGDSLRRFCHEAEIQGRLRHPGIGHIYEAGIAQSPYGQQPYFVMELVEGRPITQYARETNLGTDERLRLIIKVCDAVQHAHDHGIVHRDLKPGNIVVEAGNQPKVLDFGIARATDSDMQITMIQTAVGQLLGTVPYMSPEQIAGDKSRLDHRSDIYSLGVVLYELLADKLPHDLISCSIPQAAKIIQDQDPPKVGSIMTELRGEIETIVAAAMEKEPDRRYASASALADDLRRVLAHQPIRAKRPGTFYQLARFARRNKAFVGGVVATIIALMIGIIAAAGFAYKEAQQHTLAVAAQKQAQQQTYRVCVAAASNALKNQNVLVARRLLEEAPEEHRGWEWDFLMSRFDNSISTFSTGVESIDTLRFSPDGDEIMGHYLQSYARWDWKNERTIDVFHGSHERHAVASPDKTYFATIESNDIVSVVDTAGGATYINRNCPPRIETMAIDANNELLAFSTRDARFQIRRIQDGQVLHDVQMPSRSHTMTWSPTGQVLARRHPGELVVVAVEPSREIARFELPQLVKRSDLAWSPDGRVVNLIEPDDVDHAGRLRRFQVDEARELEPLIGHDHSPSTLKYTQSGARALTSSRDGTARLWNTESGTLLATFAVQFGAAFSATFNPDESLIAVGNSIGTVLVFDARTNERIAQLNGHESPAQSVAFTPDGNLIAAGAADGNIRFWPTSLTRQTNVLRGHESYVYPVVFSPDGNMIASASWDGTVRLWNPHTGEPLRVIKGHDAPTYLLAFNRNGTKLVSYGHRERLDNETIVEDLETGRQYRIESQRQRPGMAPAFHDDDEVVWLPGLPGPTVRFWRYPSGEITELPIRSLREVRSPLMSPDKRHVLLISGDDQSLDIVELATGNVVHQITDHAMLGNWSPDGERIVVISRSTRDRLSGDRISVWDAHSGGKLADLQAHVGDVFDAQYSPDGTRIMTCGRDEQIRIWDADSLMLLISLNGHTEYVWSIAFDPTGRRFASGSGDGTVRIWDSSMNINPN